MTRFIAAAVLAVFTPLSGLTAEEAKPSLRDVAAIENPLFAVAVAQEVAEQCDTIAARTFKGLRLLYSLRSTANGLGYSDREIRAYIDSDQEKARMRAKGERLLRQNGVNLDDPETFCAYGRAEIQKNSAIGVLLRAK
ncbi:hypothetical protein TRM7557_02881 [Tritonibacter multivorans]|uniref:NADH dehydrogenase subunit E n=1 Tax=Tritonibacter multivorans TaxID=928856 RepID=A0A0P1GFD6_9RHOB|nr:DUF5333 domain-containing protein [Tritonibacter multivorans]MDA7420980.1 DUF5333 domain-containing protein [Tritonibacter multivorans]CUH80412.1 hypothetical protein TRM7557_02881 [Tritonibacter multivorans]SFC79691.1 hypothetical protein SAMN04488049_104164 [Tritonibacter multivorans]